MALTEGQVEEHLMVLRIAFDSDSPFYKKINFNDGLLSLPIKDQWQIFNRMDPELRAMFEKATGEKRKEASKYGHNISK